MNTKKLFDRATKVEEQRRKKGGGYVINIPYGNLLVEYAVHKNTIFIASIITPGGKKMKIKLVKNRKEKYFYFTIPKKLSY